MFMIGTLNVDPPQPTDYVRGEGQSGDVVEVETFSTSQILQQLVFTLRRCDITNCVRLICDGETLFEDLQGQGDDLTTAIRSLAGADEDTRRTFEQVRLVLEHRGDLLRVIIDVEVTRVHDVDVCPVVVNLAGFLHGLRADGDWTAKQEQKFQPVFSSQETCDAVSAAVREEFEVLLKRLQTGFLLDMRADDVESDWECRIVDRTVPAAEWSSHWHLLFDQSTLTEDDVRYCFLWDQMCEQRGLQLSHCETVGASGIVLRRYGKSRIPVAGERPSERARHVTWDESADSVASPSPDAAGMTESERATDRQIVNPLSGCTYPRSEWPSSFTSFFGPRKRDVWQLLASRIGAEFRKGGFFNHDDVFYHWDNRRICLSTETHSDGESSTTYTTMTAANAGRPGLRCSLTRRGFLSGFFGKLFNLQDIIIGDEAFDEAFIIKGRDEAAVRLLLADPWRRELISLQPRLSLHIDTDIRFSAYGVIKDPNQLLRLFELFVELMIWCRRTST